jgi:hypothetical protein
MSTQYFALVGDDNIVTQVEVVTAEYIAENPSLYTGNWVETFIDNPDKTYAGIGYTYNATTDDFIAPVYVPPTPPEPVPTA